MPHPASSRAALRAVLGFAITALAVLLPGVGTAGSAGGARVEVDPIVVRLDAITAVLPRRGTVDVAGTVTNTSDVAYTRVNVYGVSSVFPIVEPAALVDSAASPAHTYIGERETDGGTFATIDVLLPGATASFSLSVPVELLDASGEPGVYEFGVQALGETVDGRDDLADGRVRTFLPALPRGDGLLEAAVILPLRGRVWYQPDGRLGGEERWAHWLADGGRLDTLLDIAEATAGREHTWLVDPAVLHALYRLGKLNPPRSIAPDQTVPQEPAGPTDETTDEPSDPATDAPPEGETPDPSSQTLTPPSTTTDEEEQEEPTAEELALASAAQGWLTRFGVTNGGGTVLALPFGDLDVSAAVRHRPQRYEQARARSARVMAELGIPATPALAPENGRLSPEAILATPVDTQDPAQDTTIILSDTAFAAPPTTRHSTARLLQHRVVLTSSGAETGGPAPTRADDPLAMRQRLLSEAALRVRAGSTAPVVMTLPGGWSAADAVSLFSAFDEPWLDPVSVAEVAGRPATGVTSDALLYTQADVDEELHAANFLAADRLDQSAALLEEVLAMQTRVQQQVADELLVTLSEQHRARPRLAQRSAAAVREHIADQLASIEIEPIRKVVLSSDSGHLGATVVNGLDQPVTIEVMATSDGEMVLEGPGPRRLAPRARSSFKLNATAERAGVHNVRLAVISGESRTSLGSSARFPIRAAEVSGLIWVVMAAGAALLLSAAGLRVWRKVRGGDAVPASPEPSPSEEQQGANA